MWLRSLFMHAREGRRSQSGEMRVGYIFISVHRRISSSTSLFPPFLLMDPADSAIGRRITTQSKLPDQSVSFVIIIIVVVVVGPSRPRDWEMREWPRTVAADAGATPSVSHPAPFRPLIWLAVLSIHFNTEDRKKEVWRHHKSAAEKPYHQTTFLCCQKLVFFPTRRRRRENLGEKKLLDRQQQQTYCALFSGV